MYTRVSKLTLVAVEMLKKCTKPIFLSRTIFTWSISPKRLRSSRSCSSVIASSRPPKYTFRLALLCWMASATWLGTGEGLPQPILSSCPWSESFLISASAWKAAAVEPSRNDKNTQDFSGSTRIDSSGPK